MSTLQKSPTYRRSGQPLVAESPSTSLRIIRMSSLDRTERASSTTPRAAVGSRAKTQLRRRLISGLAVLALSFGLSVGVGCASAFGADTPAVPVTDVLSVVDSGLADPVDHGAGVTCLAITCLLLVLAICLTTSRRDVRPMAIRARPAQVLSWPLFAIPLLATAFDAPRRC